MNKKIWIAALLVTVMAVAAGCGSKPTAAPNQTQGAGTENNVTEVEGETITEPVTAEPEENTTPTESTEGSSEEETTTTPPSETSTEKPATSESNEKKTITVFYTDEEELSCTKLRQRFHTHRMMPNIKLPLHHCNRAKTLNWFRCGLKKLN